MKFIFFLLLIISNYIFAEPVVLNLKNKEMVMQQFERLKEKTNNYQIYMGHLFMRVKGNDKASFELGEKFILTDDWEIYLPVTYDPTLIMKTGIEIISPVKTGYELSEQVKIVIKDISEKDKIRFDNIRFYLDNNSKRNQLSYSYTDNQGTKSYDFKQISIPTEFIFKIEKIKNDINFYFSTTGNAFRKIGDFTNISKEHLENAKLNLFIEGNEEDLNESGAFFDYLILLRDK